MVSIEWCMKQRKGLEIISPNKNMAESYLNMAEESIKILSKISESNIWTAATSYYIYYYSLYAMMLRIGVKCEIHTCSIEFMKECLSDFYSLEDITDFEEAFNARIDLQYYSNRPVNQDVIERSKKHCKMFFIKTKIALSKIREAQILETRKKLVKFTTLK